MKWLLKLLTMKVREREQPDVTPWDTKRQTMIPSDGQRIADDSLTATSVLYVHCNGCRVGHVSETTLWKQTGMMSCISTAE